MSYLLDTNHCSYIINGDPDVTDIMEDPSREAIGINIINYAELLYMTEKSQRKLANRMAVETFLEDADLYFIDEETAIIYSRIKTAVFNAYAPKEKSKRRRTSVSNLGFSDHDLWIVATAIQHSLNLVSSDSDFRRIQQVQPFSLESWKLS